MLARVVMTAVLALGLVGALRPEAEAHLAGTIGKIHYSSVTCINTVTGVPGSALGDDPKKPAFLECNLLVTHIEILCLNSQGHPVSSQAGINVTIGATSNIDDGSITNKKKGIATVETTIETEPFLDPEFCTSHTWVPQAVLVTEFEVEVLVKQCTNSTCAGTITTSKENQHCVIPPGFTVENLPPVGTEYQCVPGPKLHLN